MSHFSDIGFHINTPEDFDRLLTSAVSFGEVLPARRGTYVLWSPDGAIEMWVQTNHEDQVVGVNPHYNGRGRLTLTVEATHWNEDIPLDGSLIGSGTMEPLRLMVDMPDFDLVEAQLIPDSEVTLQIAAFAHTLAAFSDEADFAANSYKMESGEGFAPESLVPTGLFLEEATAEVFLSGRVIQAEQRVNPITKAAFWHVLAQTFGGTLDVVADPALVNGEPQAGGLVQGTFWLSARLALNAMGGAGKTNGKG